MIILVRVMRGNLQVKSDLITVSFRYLGNLYGYYLHDYTRAERAYRRAIVNDLTDADSFFGLADFYWDTQIPAFRERVPNVLLEGIGSATNKLLLLCVWGVIIQI